MNGQKKIRDVYQLVKEPVSGPSTNLYPNGMKITYSITFDKTDFMRYISHLDLMRLFSRAMRRAGFNLYLSKGFNPRPVIRVKDALKLGLKGEDQQAEFVLSERISTDEFKERIKEQLPEGITVKTVVIARSEVTKQSLKM